MEEKLVEYVQDKEFDVRLLTALDECKYLEVIDALPKVCERVHKSVCAAFLTKKITPYIFDRNTDEIGRTRGLRIGLVLLYKVNITNLPSKVQEQVIATISDKYLEVLEELSEKSDVLWDQLWIFLVKSLNTKLHSNIVISNKLLRLMEKAFRNQSSVDPRVKAFDCWRELIDNFSLDKKHMFSDKKMQLLMTPLRVKLKRIPIVISKRLEVFVHLLKQVEDNVPKVLTAFLNMAFGPFEEEFTTSTTLDSKNTPEICKKMTVLLMEIIGHSHGEGPCIDYEETTFDQPLVNQNNFDSLAEVLIRSVLECCCLLYDWNEDKGNNHNIVKCLWCGLMDFIHNCDDENKTKWCKEVEKCINFLQSKMNDSKKYQDVLANVVDVLITRNLQLDYKPIFNSVINILKYSSPDGNLSQFSLFALSSITQQSEQLGNVAIEHFENDPNVVNLNFMAQLWLHIENINTTPTIQFLLWPLRYLDKFDDQKALLEIWSKLYNVKCKDLRVSVIQEMEKMFADNPLLSCNIVKLLELVDMNLNPGKEIIYKLTKLISSMLSLPNQQFGDVDKLAAILLKLLTFYQEDNDDFIEKFCQAVDCIVMLHKHYTFLEKLRHSLKRIPDKMMKSISKNLIILTHKLKENEDIKVAGNAEKLQKLLGINENHQKQNVVSSRGLRIVNMSQNGSPSIFSSPSIRGSQLALISQAEKTKESSPKSTPKKTTLEDNSSDYVPFDTVVRFDPSKLNEHQKEVMKRRRDDIPAMYQDLSQSQTMEFSNSTSQEPSEKVATHSDLFSQQELRVSSPSELGFFKKSPIIAHHNILNTSENKSEVRRSKRQSVKEKTISVEEKMKKANQKNAKDDTKRRNSRTPTKDSDKSQSQETDIIEETPIENGLDHKAKPKKKKKPARLTLGVSEYKTRRRSKISPKNNKVTSSTTQLEDSADVISPTQNNKVKVITDEKQLFSEKLDKKVPVEEKPPESLPDTQTCNAEPYSEPLASEDLIESEKVVGSSVRDASTSSEDAILQSPSTKKSTRTPTRTSPRNADTSTPLKQPVDESVEELPASPITNDTSVRNDELMESTRDISPISFANTNQNEINYEPRVILSKRSENILKMIQGEEKDVISSAKKPKDKKQNNMDVLSFSREIPSPLAMPIGGILKRKLNASDDPIVPSPKRKRVSFPIPAITARKVFLKENEDDSVETSMENGDNVEQTESQVTSSLDANEDALLESIEHFSNTLEPEQMERFMIRLIQLPRKILSPGQFLRTVAPLLTDLLP